MGVTNELSFPLCTAAAACVASGACDFTVRHINPEKCNSFSAE